MSVKPKGVLKGRNSLCQTERGIEGQEQFVSVNPKGVLKGRNSLCKTEMGIEGQGQFVSNRKGY